MKQALAARRRTSGQSGFTLIELLVVIAILAILAGVVVFAVSGIQDNGEQSACDIDLRTVKTAAEAYRAENGSYATSEAALVSGGFLESESANYTYTSAAAGPPSYAPVSPCT
jgi:general secretion pathway protein G